MYTIAVSLARAPCVASFHDFAPDEEREDDDGDDGDKGEDVAGISERVFHGHERGAGRGFAQKAKFVPEWWLSG